MASRPNTFWLILVFLACALVAGSAAAPDQQRRPAPKPAPVVAQPEPPPSPVLGRPPAI